MCGWSHSAHCKVLNPVLPSAFLITTPSLCFSLLTPIKHFLCVRYHSAKGRVCSRAELPSSATVQAQNSVEGSDIRELAFQSHPGIQRVASPEKAGGETPAAHRLSHHPYLGCTRQSEQMSRARDI